MQTLCKPRTACTYTQPSWQIRSSLFVIYTVFLSNYIAKIYMHDQTGHLFSLVPVCVCCMSCKKTFCATRIIRNFTSCGVLFPSILSRYFNLICQGIVCMTAPGVCFILVLNGTTVCYYYYYTVIIMSEMWQVITVMNALCFIKSRFSLQFLRKIDNRATKKTS